MTDFPAFLKEAASVKPSARQMNWYEMGFYAFIHFSPNTYTGLEWGTGKEDPAVFDPWDLDCDEWCEALKSAGMKGMILTAKHHDGFCLWPSRYTEHCVRNSPGCRDVVREASDACRRHGLKFGFYLSPWDRNQPSYGTEAYNDYYCRQLEELLTGYGDIFCVWFDGACGEGPNGIRQQYDFDRYIRLIRKLQPNAVIFNDHGPDIRWIGNEDGKARSSEWAVVPKELCPLAEVQTGPGPLEGDLTGIYNSDISLGELPQILYSRGLVFCPSETDFSIRPGWFYHPEEQPHSLERLFDVYLHSAGGNGCLNLNVPPMPSGRFDPKDIRRLKELGDLIRQTFARDRAQNADIQVHSISPTQQQILLTLSCEQEIRYLELREDLRFGQRIESFRAEWKTPDDVFSTLTTGTTVGFRKIIRLETPVRTGQLKLTITGARDLPHLLPIQLY